jgi:hypothetical protein
MKPNNRIVRKEVINGQVAYVCMTHPKPTVLPEETIIYDVDFKARKLVNKYSLNNKTNELKKIA